jgi:ribosomal protein S12 methylthiotransferase
MPGFYLLNLGCAKNLVEGEHLAGMLLAKGWQAVQSPGKASALIVNTCAFIQPAVAESVQAILELAGEKQSDQMLAVVGCLVGRYGKKLARSLPEVDLLVAPGEVHRLDELLRQPPPERLAISSAQGIFTSKDPRALSTGPGWAYMRLADGCGQRCSFCTIPGIRGKLRSRSREDLLLEARFLAKSGVKELNLVAQDLTSYGLDLEAKPRLAGLIRELAEVPEIEWIRLLYLYPDNLDDELIQAMAETNKVIPYFDLPLQHIADPVLDLMGRRRTGREIKDLIGRIREMVPDAVLRTTLMVGHPGEGPQEYIELLDFVAQTRFDHLGCFAFQPEPGTKSARLQAPERHEARERQERVMALQRDISRENLARLKGSTLPVLVLGPHPESDLLWQGRLASQAPEVDGEVIITQGTAPPGSIALCKINKCHDYDLEAELVDAGD